MVCMGKKKVEIMATAKVSGCMTVSTTSNDMTDVHTNS
jgi:hypothetical protein